MKNIEIANIFMQMADILEFNGESPFKVNAYRKGARILEEMTEDIESVWQSGNLQDIPGIGKALYGKIESFLTHGNIPQFDELLKDTPKDLFLLLKIPNFGPKTAALAYKELKVQTLDDLKTVIESGKLESLPGMGAKRVEKIKKSVELLKASQERLSIGLAIPIVQETIDYLNEHVGDKIIKITTAGSTRRGRETVHDIDILVSSENPQEVIECFTQMPGVTSVLGSGSTKGSIIVNDREQIDLRAVPEESFGAALQYFTGSKAHNVKLRGIAKSQGYKINEYGIFKDDTKVGGETEKEIYEQLGLVWIPPELREDRGEIEAAAENTLPELITDTDMLADLHMHTHYSDGQLSIQEMAEAVRQLGYKYMAITDHSASAFYANGLQVDRLKKQIDEIHEINSNYSDFEILAGSEVDILPNGNLDFDDEMLKQLDFVVASIHSAFTTKPTERTLAAIENPFVDVIGHPTGRLISRREGFNLDMEKVMQRAAETGTALEVNAYWDRLDLSDIHIKQAISMGVKLSINTDSHHTRHLSMMQFGIATARRGWATKFDVINTMSLEQLRTWQKRNN